MIVKHMIGFKEPPETGYTCPLCGFDVEWWKEPYEFMNGYICHEKCLVNMEDEPWETV